MKNQTLICKENTNPTAIQEDFIKEVGDARGTLFLLPLENYVDIGTHYGANAYEAHRRGAQEIYCFEASSTNAEIATMLLDSCNITNYKLFNYAAAATSGNIVKLRKVISGENGRLENASSGQYTITNYEHEPQYKISEEFEPCTTISLEDIFTLCDIQTIRTMKVDIEGAEYDFLMNKDFSKVDSMYVEFHCGAKKNEELCRYLNQYFDIIIAYTAVDNATYVSEACGGPPAETQFIDINTIDFSKELHNMSFLNRRLSDNEEMKFHLNDRRIK
jgi:FkbM family methyltransferase